MPFIPNSSLKEEMLKEIGLKDIDELFSDIPEEIRIKDLNLPEGLTEEEVVKKLRKISKKNKPFPDLLSFLGGGIKPHYVPSAVKHILMRSEFYTSYTPYQPEASQGILQAMFEYQSIISELTGMDIANCSLYDMSTSLGEAVRMCMRINRKKRILVPRNISWERKSVLKNYIAGLDAETVEVDYDRENGRMDISDLERKIDNETCCLYVENPNYFGIFEEDVEEISEIVHGRGALLIVGVDLLSLALVRPPGDYNADIAISEGRTYGTGMNMGGSSLGIFACRKEFLRNMPGRIIGLTHDVDGNRAFCMTLQTREQHIRREKATSNICTNESLNALATLVYLSLLGSRGFVELAKRNLENARKLYERLTSLPWFKPVFSGSYFNEFVLRSSQDVYYMNKELLKRDIIAGLPLEKYFPELERCMLFGITEIYSEEDIERLIKAIKEVYHV